MRDNVDQENAGGITASPRSLTDLRSDLASTGIDGLDTVLAGGLPRRHLYLVQGQPGTGKTTLAMQFLLAGRDKGESVLYVTLSESAEDLRTSAAAHGWNMEGVEIYEHTHSSSIGSDAYHTLFHPNEVDLTETMDEILEVADRLKPERIVFDSLSELRLLSGDELRYRRQIIALRDDFTRRNCTVMMLDDKSLVEADIQLQSVAHGVILLSNNATDYGSERRRLRIVKLRCVRYSGGYHDYTIITGGLCVFPRLIAAEHREEFDAQSFESGIAELDKLFGGGVDRGTTTILLGPSGVGKSTISTQYAVAAAERGEKTSFYIFDERIPSLFGRAEGLGMHLKKYVDQGLINVKMIDPAELSPGEFAQEVRRSVEEDGVSLVIIDSLVGYLNAMPETRFLTLQLHELLTYLGQKGVTTLMVATQHGLISPDTRSDFDVSYICDNLLLFRYYEIAGVVEVALSVFKRRSGSHERTIRKLTLNSENGIKIGEPMRDFSGIMSGVPIYEKRYVGTEVAK